MRGADGVDHIVHIAFHFGALGAVGSRLVHDDIGDDERHAVVAEAVAIDRAAHFGAVVVGGLDILKQQRKSRGRLVR